MRNIAKKIILLLIIPLIAGPSTTTARGSLTVGLIKKPFLDGCGCYLQFPSDYKRNNERYIFLGDLDKNAQMNIDGKDLTLKLVSRREPRGATTVGSRWSEVYTSEETKVRIEYVVRRLCDPTDEGCEVTWYSARITITRNGVVRKVKALGVCGC
jgi:hypothetical protein